MKNTERKALVLDDDFDAAALVSRILSNNGYVVTTVHSIAEAGTTIEKDVDYDLLFLDYNLQDGNSLDFIEGKELEHYNTILCSAYLTDENIAKANDLNVFCCLRKPISRVKIIEALQSEKLQK